MKNLVIEVVGYLLSHKEIFGRLLPKRIRRMVRKIVQKTAVAVGYNINTKEYWDSIWQEEGLDTWRVFPILFENILSAVPANAKVLDVACGVGKLLKLIQEEKNTAVYGLDISSVAIQKLKNQGISGVVADCQNIPFKENTFDVVIATEILEHLSNPVRTLEEIHRVLKIDGLLIVSVPNSVKGPSHTLEHLRAYNKASLEQQLTIYFSDIKTITVSEFDCEHLLSYCKNFERKTRGS